MATATVTPAAVASTTSETAGGYLLTLRCAEQPGIVHEVSGFLVAHGCDIVDNRQFGDREAGRFFMRLHFQVSGVSGSGQDTAAGAPARPGGEELATLRQDFAPIATRFGMEWHLEPTDHRPRLLLLVSRFGHCLQDLLYRWTSGVLRADVVGVVSNHRDFAGLAAAHGLPFHHLPVTPESKADRERRLLEIVEEEQVDLVVLARYMQVLSPELCEALAGRVVNIHHSFLPSFAGARPYHQAHERGVKLIGATAHFVTPDLDEGPIIEQEVVRVDHTRTAAELAAIGREVEAATLGHAVQWIVERRVLLNGHRTVVFR